MNTWANLRLLFALCVMALATAVMSQGPTWAVRGSGVVQLLQNNGTGSFAVVPNALPFVPSVQALYGGDVDADGDQDLLVAVATGAPLQLWLGAGNGTFSTAAAILPLGGTGHAVVDLDGDLRADLLQVANTPQGQVLNVFRNLGGLQLGFASSAPVDATMNLGEPVVADLEADGDLDAILGGSLFFLHDGNLGFAALQQAPIAETTVEDTVVAGDLDGDEMVDLVVGDTMHLNQGDGYCGNAGAVLPTGAKARALADIDIDGDLDLVWNGAVNSVAGGGVLWNQVGAFTPGPVFPPGLSAGRVEVVDFDNDGWLDLISESRRVLRNLGGQAFVTVATIAPPERFVTTADFDADGLVDIVTADPTSWRVWRNVGGFVFQPSTASQPTSPIAAVARDFDANGLLDLVTSTTQPPSPSGPSFLQVWYQQPSGWVAGSLWQDGGEITRSLAVADFDQDGDLDLVGQSLWTNIGSGFVGSAGWVNYSSMIALADMDADRDIDIVRAASLSSNATRPYVYMNRLIDIDADRLPLLGRPYPISVASRAGQGVSGDLVVAALALTRIAPIAVPGLGLLQIDPQSIVASPLGVTGSNGLFTFPLVWPAQPALAGMEVYWQGVAANANGLRLTGLLIDRLLF